MACKKLLTEIVGDKFLSITLVRENPLDVKTQTDIQGAGFGSHKVAMAELRMYADIACAVVFDQKAAGYFSKEPILPEFIEIADKFLKEGNHAKYYEAIKSAYGVMIYIVECEINPSSNLLREGPRLTAYKLIKQQNNNLRLILVVFEGTKVDNPGVFDDVWEFPKKDS
jgi:hypothetical protein